jgi:predicted nucleic acid-binding protein
MITVLVDTSVLVNFVRGTQSKASVYLRDNVGEMLIATCPVIVQEILQGVLTDKDFVNTRSFFDETIQLSNNPYEMAVEGAMLYKMLRKQGVTVRKPNDCLIAVYAIKNNIPILHDDKDFDNIAKYSDLKIVDVK